jgi:hypothetical protein
VTTSAGYSVLVTADHEIEVGRRWKGWVAAKDLLRGDVLTILKPESVGVQDIESAIQKRLVEIFSKEGFIAKKPFLHVHLRPPRIITPPCGKQPDVRISRAQYLSLVQLMLLHIGIYSHTCKTHLRIATQDLAIFRDKVGFASPEKKAILATFKGSPSKFKAFVKDVRAEGVQEVADLAMPYAQSFSVGGIKVHNCFAESKARDAIGTMQEKEQLSFAEACYKLEEMFGLPHPAQVDSYEPATPSLPDKVIQVDLMTTFMEDAQQTDRLLLYLTKERVLDQKMCFSFWEAYDQILWLVHDNTWTGTKGKEALAKLRGKALEVGAKALNSLSS